MAMALAIVIIACALSAADCRPIGRVVLAEAPARDGGEGLAAQAFAAVLVAVAAVPAVMLGFTCCLLSRKQELGGAAAATAAPGGELPTLSTERKAGEVAAKSLPPAESGPATAPTGAGASSEESTSPVSLAAGEVDTDAEQVYSVPKVQKVETVTVVTPKAGDGESTRVTRVVSEHRQQNQNGYLHMFTGKKVECFEVHEGTEPSPEEAGVADNIDFILGGGLDGDGLDSVLLEDIGAEDLHFLDTYCMGAAEEEQQRRRQQQRQRWEEEAWNGGHSHPAGDAPAATWEAEGLGGIPEMSSPQSHRISTAAICDMAVGMGGGMGGGTSDYGAVQSAATATPQESETDVNSLVDILLEVDDVSGDSGHQLSGNGGPRGDRGGELATATSQPQAYPFGRPFVPAGFNGAHACMHAAPGLWGGSARSGSPGPEEEGHGSTSASARSPQVSAPSTREQSPQVSASPAPSTSEDIDSRTPNSAAKSDSDSAAGGAEKHSKARRSKLTDLVEVEDNNVWWQSKVPRGKGKERIGLMVIQDVVVEHKDHNVSFSILFQIEGRELVRRAYEERSIYYVRRNTGDLKSRIMFAVITTDPATGARAVRAKDEWQQAWDIKVEDHKGTPGARSLIQAALGDQLLEIENTAAVFRDRKDGLHQIQ